MRCTQREPDKRYQSVAEIEIELEKAERGRNGKRGQIRKRLRVFSMRKKD